MKILGKIPRNHFHVAVSGGTDSMVLVDFLKKYPKNKFDILYFNHGTRHGSQAQTFLARKCNELELPLIIGQIHNKKSKSQSQEEYWRVERYKFLSEFSDEPILMAHQLDDVLETYIMTSLHGNPRIIPYSNPKYNIIRPLILVPKIEIYKWLTWNNVEHLLDPSNKDTSFIRNYIRIKMKDDILRINPGIYKTLSKLIMNNYNKSL